MILDDLAAIHRRDSLDLLGIAGRRWRELSGPQVRGVSSLNGDNLRNVVLVAAGEDLSWLRLASGWPGCSLPFEVVGPNRLPAYVGQGSLVIVASDAAVAAEAERRGATVAWSSQSGAALYAVACQIMVAAGVAADRSAKDARHVDWRATANRLEQAVAAWKPDVPASRNLAKQLALEIAGKSAVIYGDPLTYAAACFWKTSFNRHAKHLAWVARFPDDDIAEPAGWISQPVNKPYAVIELMGDLENGGSARAWSEQAKRSLSGMRPEPHVVQLEGEPVFQQLYAAMLGEHVSIYLALLAGTDPAPSDILRKFKT